MLVLTAASVLASQQPTVSCTGCATAVIDATSALLSQLTAFDLLLVNNTSLRIIVAPAPPSQSLPLTVNWKNSFDTAIPVRLSCLWERQGCLHYQL